jgi:hypothetical protein
MAVIRWMSAPLMEHFAFDRQRKDKGRGVGRPLKPHLRRNRPLAPFRSNFLKGLANPSSVVEAKLRRGANVVAGARLTVLLASVVIAGWASSGQCVAAEASGTTVAVVQSASARGVTGSRVLQIRGPVFMGDRVQTGHLGEAQIKFLDDTRMVVGANSSLVIDKFVFDPGAPTARQVSMQALRGAFRFITGNSPKRAYKITTPTMTMGIRGTKFDFTIRGNGDAIVALYEGEAQLCERSDPNQCIQLRGGCSVAVFPRRERGRQVDSFQERARLLASLPYAMSQVRLRRDFWVDTSSCGIRRIDLEDPLDQLNAPFPNAPAAPGPVPAPAPAPAPPPAVHANAGPGNGGESGSESSPADTDPGNSGTHNSAPPAPPGQAKK